MSSKFAIVGMSCLFPGADTPGAFWDNLRAGVDSRAEGGPEVFGPADPRPADGMKQVPDPDHAITCVRGGFVTGFEFDPNGFHLRPENLAGLDRVFHWSLHVAREALRDSGHADRPELLARTGLVVGDYSFPTPASARISLPLVHEAVLEGLRRSGNPAPAPGPLLDLAAVSPADARVSGAPARLAATALGLGGPRYALDAACSSALYALKLACDHLATGQADLVLAGGVCAPDPTLIHLSFSDLHAYPQNGVSQPFDARSTGILTGQGAGMVAVRRLADAMADGDRVYAVIDGVGLSNDGAGRHLLVPNPAGQLSAYELAYAQAGFGPEQVDYLECHATGTPVGDGTEAQSVAAWFGTRGAVPPLGSVKGNLGHLLTVAGLSSLLKVILAMGHGHLPPTIGIDRPLSTPGAGEVPVVRAGRDWPDRGPGPRRAAVSAFGFGGTNAHVVLSQRPDDREAGAAEPVVPPSLDVIGLGAHFGTLADVPAFERALHDGTDAFQPLPEHRWRGLEDTGGGTLERAGLHRAALPEGGFVDRIDVDPADHRIPPADLRNYNLQHALMSKVADEALRDAGYERTVPAGRRAPEPRRIAVVVAMEIEPSAHLHLARYGLGDFLRRAYDDAGLELTEEQFAAVASVAREGVHEPIVANEVLSYIGNIMASRISSLWNLTGPAFTVSSDGAGTAEALQIAQLLLLDESVEAVLVGAVDLAASPENLLLRGEKPVSGAGLSFGEGQRGRRIGEGAGAVVVTRPGAGERQAYARIDSVAVRHATPVDGVLAEAHAGTLAEAAGQALAAAGIGPADVGYVEAHAGGTPGQDSAELAALAQVYPAGSGTVALGSAKAQLGDTQTAAAMAGLLRAVLCLHHAYVPGAPGWRRPAPELVDHFTASAFHVPGASRPWLRTAQGVRRYAAVSAIGSDGAHAHVVLSADRTRGDVARSDWRKAGGPALLPLGAPDLDGLLAEVDRHLGLLAGGADPYRLGRAAAESLPGSALRVVLVGRDTEQLRAQLELAARDLSGAAAKGEEWTTPAGSCFAPRPIGPEGKVALVYPGAFNSYPGLGQDFFRAFPSLLDAFEAEAADPDRLFRASQLYPRGQVTPGRRELMAQEGRLGEDIPFMLATGTTFAILYTDLVRELLDVRAHGAFGYSLGESSMLFATGGWRRSARRDDRISATPLFRDRLSGPRRTVRELWELPEDTPDEAVWGSFVLLESADRITSSLSRSDSPYDKVFLTHVNTPREAVIAGDPVQCRALVAELGCPSARSPVGSVMHCPVVDGELAGLAELNDHPTGSPGGLDLLSAYDYGSVTELERSEVARRIARTLRGTIDFPRLVRTAYERGFRYFVEVGPGATCTRWVHDTLGDAEHVAMPVDRRGVPAARSVAQLAARLAAHGLPVDLTALLGPDPAPATRPDRLRVPVGGGAPIPAGIAARAVAAPAALATPARPEPAHVGVVAVRGSTEPAYAAVDVKDARPARTAADLEVPAPMPADPSLDDIEVITFDGEPIAFLPWAEPSAPAPAPVRTSLAPSAPVSPPPAPVPPSGWSPSSAAADLVREIRQQMVATHSVVMETQRVLQENTLARTEALLDQAFVPAPSTAPVAPAAPPPVLPSGPPPPVAIEAAPRTAQAPQVPKAQAPDVIWDEEQLLAFATGRITDVFGPEFADVDGYTKRVRLPAPPYHFVTRVTGLRARTGVYEPSFIRTEYDVPKDAWYAVDGGVPPAVAIEAGQCDLLLISYLGIDFRNKGERVYRLLDSTLVFHGDLPRTGQTLRYDISINRFVRQGDTTLFFFSYLCYADGELILELKDASAGFFTQAELDTPLGVVVTERDRKRRAALTRTTFKPLADTGKNRLTAADLELLAAGKPGEVFGPHHAQDAGLNPALRLPDARLRMVDEIRIDRTGGPRGIGAISARKQLEPDAWYFECHFPDDPVLAGSMVAEGAVQTLQAYLLHQGMHLVLPDARFQTIIGLETEVQVRGQITPRHREIRYEIEVMELTLLPRPSVVADILVYLGDKAVIRMRNFGIQIREKDGTPYRAGPGGIPEFLGRRNRAGEPALINELHLAHAAKGDLGTAMGPEFDVYQESRAPYIPNGDFQFVDRIMKLTGTRGELKPGAEMVTEYDSPSDAWYYRENAHPHLPNCVLMETSLQAAILNGYYLGATLKQPETEYSIRNLDGRATYVKDIDLRGRTIRHRSTLLMTSAVSGAVLQNFSYELSADGEVFYTGESLFGYFSEAALANQVGLDNGTYVAPWIEQEKPDASRIRRVELPDDAPAFTDPTGGRLRLPGGHYHLVDHVDLVTDGGRHGAGYLHGYRQVRPDEWYFDCHFHRDPVMPGSLGVEAILQGLRLFVLEQGLAEGIENPRFGLAVDVPTSWKYRGQILRHDGELRFDVHVKEVRRNGERLVVIADADLWKPGLRIYELTDVAIEVSPDTTRDRA
ncbi:beta-ketoacyl synthase N-terminal-like domain-containing protein [Streptomyces sp. ADMS]|uniref:beta-ketoacyl synthase N-terminal-like domain-containing protein n=1 Tax=Streptomyces sp. ADMS TaxID=3071415 RepID=UPI0029700628|nr:beta-ketoacyl synthase N-terminal-like domain-containing protein [Streptomyces sp. ADMS]MDW4904117.1 beta-ketoacyl synthase N-terminal-like domain-containing protein [Streptomyces sp. ADMS]